MSISTMGKLARHKHAHAWCTNDRTRPLSPALRQGPNLPQRSVVRAEAPALGKGATENNHSNAERSAVHDIRDLRDGCSCTRADWVRGDQTVV